MTFDPHDIGKRKPPEVNDTAPYLKNTDQRWLSEVGDEYPSHTPVWDGEGYAPDDVIRRIARRHLWLATGRIARRVLSHG